MLHNTIFLEIGPHPPPRNANNIEHYTFVTLFSRKSDTPNPHLRYVTLEWPHTAMPKIAKLTVIPLLIGSSQSNLGVVLDHVQNWARHRQTQVKAI